MSTPQTEPISTSLDELFGFSEARRKAEEANVNDGNDAEEDFIQHRVFMNHVDGYHAKHISSFLTDQFYGASKLSNDEGEGEGEVEPGEEIDEQKSKGIKLNLPSFKYEIIGTLKYNFHKKSEDILYIINDSDEESFTNEIFKCGFVIYDITEDENEIPKALTALSLITKEIDKIKEIGPKTFKRYPEVRVFILISNVMTWALTKPIDPEEPDVPFTESDYKKRRPHANYKNHIACEREVVLRGRKYKDKLKTYVICSGITYGAEEEDLLFLFKLAWNNEKYLPVFAPGKNFVPFIHAKDLTKVIHGILEVTPKKQYILAVEQSPCTLKQVVKALSKSMGSGKIREVSAEEAFLYPMITQKVFERLTVNLNMEPNFIVEDMEIEWQNEQNLAENMNAVVADFRKVKELKPWKIIILGPPGVGKSKVAEKIHEKYGCYYITVKNTIENAIQDLHENIEQQKAKIKAKEEKLKAIEEEENVEPEEGEEEEEEEVDIDDLQEQLKDIETAILESENGKLPDDYVIKLLKTIMSSNICQNQGYILDGYPKTIQQAQELFGGGVGGEEEEAGEEEEGGNSTVSKILPDYVISLEATDNFICQRIMNLPEEKIQDTHYTEEHMIRRLETFRANNTEDNTPLNYFNEIEIHPIVIDIMDDKSEDMEKTISTLFSIFGPYKGFGLSPEEEIEIAKCEAEKQQLLHEELALMQQLLEKEAIEEYQKKMEEWTRLLEQLQIEEEKHLVAEGEPLRHFLMKFIFPTLAKGLIEVARIKPNDPVDFLAEYLFKENPEGHMFDPSYTRDGEHLLSDFKAIVEKVDNEDKSNKDLRQLNNESIN